MIYKFLILNCFGKWLNTSINWSLILKTDKFVDWQYNDYKTEILIFAAGYTYIYNDQYCCFFTNYQRKESGDCFKSCNVDKLIIFTNKFNAWIYGNNQSKSATATIKICFFLSTRSRQLEVHKVPLIVLSTSSNKILSPPIVY